MLKALLIRKPSTEGGTLGEFYIMDSDYKYRKFYTLEPPWKENQTDISCILAGDYICTPGISSSGNPMFKVWGVDKRTGIRIHIGNFPHETKGCILLGLTKGQESVILSRKALQKLTEIVGQRGFVLTIVEGL
jgi:hypothetical protein